MNERVAKLRQQSLDAVESISVERARLMTEYYKNAPLLSFPVLRGGAFKYLHENKTICILDGELIVGERGDAPKATPTYPVICCHSLEDLETLNSRKKTSYKVSDETKKIYEEEIIPYWKGKTIREKILAEMSDEWLAAYEAGIFTEFMEQRAPGHTVCDDKIYKKGFKDFIAEIDSHLESLDFQNDPEAYKKQQQLEGMRLSAEGIIIYAHRHAEKALELAAGENDPQRKAELEKIADVCRHVPENAPRDFYDALQYYWFVHLGVITELNPWDAFNPGRLDQHLWPFYKKGLEDGTLTEDKAKELLQCFWVKFNNQPAPPKTGVTAAESGTYTDFANINVGGMRLDGSDGVNPLSYVILDVIDEMRLLQPSSNIQLSRKNPDKFLKHACRVIRKGWGQPSVFNADAVVEELVRQGKSIEDARCGGNSGCVETGAFGKESYILTGYFNLTKIFELTLNDGVNPRTGRQLGIKTGDPREFKSFEEFMDAFRKQLHHFIEIKVRGSNKIERIYAEYVPATFMSLVIDDCIARGKDYNDGGARYNTNYVQGVGLGTLTDSLTALKKHVFDDNKVSMDEMLKALADDFQGHQRLQSLLKNKTPKYGNDDDYADQVMLEIFESFYNEVNGRKNTKGGYYRINLLPTTCHVYFGEVTDATPDGRNARVPLSEGISPVQGADRNGPTAVLKSAAKMDHIRTGGTLLNQKFTPALLEGEDGIGHMASLVRTYFRLDGHHLQFNVVAADTLRDAQKNPEQYRDLIVRVAGYSDYFHELSESLQNEIIARTEHKNF